MTGFNVALRMRRDRPVVATNLQQFRLNQLLEERRRTNQECDNDVRVVLPP